MSDLRINSLDDMEISVNFIDSTGSHVRTASVRNIREYIDEYYYSNGVDLDEFEVIDESSSNNMLMQ